MTPRLLFVGVTTKDSWVHRVLPGWNRCLPRPISVHGRDLPLDSPRHIYRALVDEFRAVDRPIGALVTSHKAALFDHAADLFDSLTPAADRLGEIGMIYWREGRLVADANDAISTREAAHQLLAASESWANGVRTAIVLGAGGAGVALTATLAETPAIGCRRILMTDVNPHRVAKVREIIDAWGATVPIEIQLTDSPDSVVTAAGQGSLIVNATGLGKDRAGCPVSEKVLFPRGATVWDLNYRFLPQEGPTFLELADAQAAERGLQAADGWGYFVWGWLVVIAAALGVPAAPLLSYFTAAAEAER